MLTVRVGNFAASVAVTLDKGGPHVRNTSGRYPLRLPLADKEPAFTLLAVASFAIGIGFNTALFTLVDALLFRSLPVERPDRLVELYTGSSDGDTYATNGYPDFVDWKAQNSVFSDMMAYSPSIAALSMGDRSRLLMGEVNPWLALRTE